MPAKGPYLGTGGELPPSWAGQRKPLGTVRRESPVLRQTPAGRLGVSSFKLSLGPLGITISAEVLNQP